MAANKVLAALFMAMMVSAVVAAPLTKPGESVVEEKRGEEANVARAPANPLPHPQRCARGRPPPSLNPSLPLSPHNLSPSYNLQHTHTARRLLAANRGGGGGWDGGVTTETIMAENDAKSGIERAVSSDTFGATYSAAQGGYRDAYASTFPDDNNGEFWLSAGTQNSVGRR